MGLREQAALDAQSILEDTSGFGWPFTLTSPLGVATARVGFTTDIGQTIDPDTGQAVAGRRASVAVSLRSLPEMPVAVADSTSKPWIVGVLSVLGVGAAWKVIEVLPDRAAGVVVLLLEAYQQAVVAMSASVLALPSLLLSGSFAPAVALGGALALPSLQLSGELAPVVELSGVLALPSLELSGELTPAVELDGALVLPALQLGGAFTPTVELGGALVLPNLELSGELTPAVSFTASMLTLPALQLAGAITPEVSFTASTLTLPSLQLAGAITPEVSFTASTLTLPSLQLAGAFTVGSIPYSACYRMAASTAVAGEWETIVDTRGGAAMTQTAAVRKLAAGVSGNGLPIGTYDGTDCMLMPLGANTYNVNTWGFALYYKLVGGGQFFNISTGAASTTAIDFYLYGNGTVYLGLYVTSATGRFYSTAAGAVPTGSYKLIRFQFDSSKTAECDTDGLTSDAKVRLFVGEVAIALTPGNIGAGATVTALRVVTGNAIWGGLSNSDTPSQAAPNGTIHGPNTYLFTTTPTAAQAVAVKNFDVPT